MRCEDFTEWLQQSLDDRADLAMPPEINDHVVRCESCRGQMNAWNQISTILPVDRPPIMATDTTSAPRANLVLWIGAVAALILVGFFAAQRLPSEGSAIAQAEPISKIEPVTTIADDATNDTRTVSSLNVDPASLWQEIQSRDWVAQSMPTVESVRDTFAPMGRSLVQAMTILATGGRDQPS